MQANGGPWDEEISAFSIAVLGTHYWNETNQEQEQHHIGIISLRANNLGILQRSPAFFSDRDLEWVGDGLEDLGDLGDLEDLKDYGVLYWLGNRIWTIIRRSGDVGPEQGLGWRKIPAISMDKIVSLLQWHLFIQHSFYSLAEKNVEKRVYYAAKCSQYLRILAFSAFIPSIHGQGHSTFITQHHSFDSTGEALGDPHIRMSLRLRDLSYRDIACLEGGVVSRFQATTPWFPIGPSAAWHCHDFHTHVDIPSS